MADVKNGYFMLTTIRRYTKPSGIMLYNIKTTFFCIFTVINIPGIVSIWFQVITPLDKRGLQVNHFLILLKHIYCEYPLEAL